MIGYLKGKVVAKAAGEVIVEVGGIGYEINLPGYVEYQLRGRQVGEEIELYILYHHPEQATRPRLFGFQNQLEREFFEDLTRVKDLGPTRALSIFASPVGKMARAIVDGDVDTLVKIKGVGPQLAKKIVAELQQRAAKYALLPEVSPEVAAPTLDDVRAEVLSVLTAQLGHPRTEALAMIEAAVKRKPAIKSAEELFDEVYRGARDQG
jgi:Holliday junction DNA helicase RuvA